MQVGVGVVDITPELGIWMSGYGGRSVATSVNDPLELQAVVMEGDNGTLAAIIASDLIGYDYDLVAEVRGELSRRHGLGPDAVMLNASHTHGGPAIINHLVVEAPHLDPAYRQRVVEAVYQAVGTALDNRQPAEPHHAWGRCTIGINRRQPGPPYAMAPNPKGFYDDTVGVLAFLEPGSGKPLAVLFNASCHPTTLGSQPIISADWPGAAKRAIESWLGEGGHALFLQAACGNIRPRTFDPGSNRFRQGTVEEFTRMG
ncbi:MAG: neutral/alkaline non-lysosomal ceramidase N-terminal domain-containing protein, partial [Armatimonadetes bacterium]|nr:neutral/alkaline non-lysosomal ceramidase N-terminal domain-containing protein [Armatimonadota bacterium]